MSSFNREQEGQGLVEYALILVLVALVSIGILTVLGPQVGNVFSRITSVVVDNTGGGGPTPNSPPVADAGGPYSGPEFTTVTLDGGASYDPDPGDSIVLYEWDVGNDGGFGNAGITFDYLIPPWIDTIEIALRVTDSHGAVDVYVTTVTRTP